MEIDRRIAEHVRKCIAHNQRIRAQKAGILTSLNSRMKFEHLHVVGDGSEGSRIGNRSEIFRTVF